MERFIHSFWLKPFKWLSMKKINRTDFFFVELCMPWQNLLSWSLQGWIMIDCCPISSPLYNKIYPNVKNNCIFTFHINCNLKSVNLFLIYDFKSQHFMLEYKELQLYRLIITALYFAVADKNWIYVGLQNHTVVIVRCKTTFLKKVRCKNKKWSIHFEKKS